jgi:SAM-dependent methyltransferase
MYTRSAALYDLIYSWKDYGREVDYLLGIIQARVPGARSVLDVACGTGEHLRYLTNFDRTGLDLDPELLRVAGLKLPDVRFVRSDMADFDLGSQFDVVLCLFSAIGYVVTVPRLNAAIACMGKHLSPGGILCVEPWFTPEQWRDSQISMRTAETEDRKVCRIFEGGQHGKTSTNTLHYLVANGGKVEYFTESHNLGLFCQEEMRQAFENAGLTVEFDPVGVEDRGLYIGRRHSEVPPGLYC